MLSFSGVEEPCALTYSISCGCDVRVVERQLETARGLRAVGTRRGHVVRVVGGRGTQHFGEDRRAARDRPVALLEDEHRRALAHHEAVAADVERARGARRIVVARRHGADDRERAEAQRLQRRLGAAREHDVGAAVPDGAQAVAHRDRARGAAHAVGRVRPVHAELDRDVAARRAAEDRERERRVHAAQPLVKEGAQLLLGESDAAQRRAHHHADPVAVLLREVHAGVLQRQLRGDDRQLREAVEAARVAARQVVLRAEVGDLRRHVAPERRRIEPGDGAHGGTAGPQSLGQRLGTGADGCDAADPGDHHPPLPVVHDTFLSACLATPASVRLAMP